MVGDDHDARPGPGHVLGTVHLDPVEPAQQESADALGHLLRQQEGDVDRRHHVAEGERQEDVDDREAGRQHRCRDAGRDHHEGGVHDVVGGDVAGPVRLGAARLHDGIERHDEQAAAHGDHHQRSEDPEVDRRRKETLDADAGRRIGWRKVAHQVMQDEAEQRHAEGAERHVAGADLALEPAVAEQRADADADREGEQEQVHHRLVAAQQVLAEGRELREEHGAHRPEPGDPDDRAEHRDVALGMAQDRPGLAEDVGVELQVRCGRPRLRDEQAGAGADRGDRHQRSGDEVQAVLAVDQHPAEHRAEEDRKERSRLDQGIAADQLVLRQVVGQDAVFERPEEGGLGAHQEQNGQQQPDIADEEGNGGRAHDNDLEQLDVEDQARFLEPVGHLPGDRREQEERQDEDAGRSGDHDPRVDLRGVGRVERDQQDQREAVGVVVERAEELRCEQRQEPPAAQEMELAVVAQRRVSLPSPAPVRAA